MNAQEIISEIEKLSPEEKQVVVDYVFSSEEEIVTKYSEEDLAELDRRYEEAKKGINVDRFSSMDEACKFFGLT